MGMIRYIKEEFRVITERDPWPPPAQPLTGLFAEPR